MNYLNFEEAHWNKNRWVPRSHHLLRLWPSGLSLSVWQQKSPTKSSKTNHFIRTYLPVWPDWAIYWTLGNFSKPFATINLPKSPTFLGNFCKAANIIHFFYWNHIWASFIDIWRFLSGHTATYRHLLNSKDLFNKIRTVGNVTQTVWP